MAGLDDELLERYHDALVRFLNGDPGDYKEMCSRTDDVTLANPFGPVARGWAEVEERLDRTTANYKDGEAVGFERLANYETPELAYLVEVERYRAKVAGGEELAPVSLRVTSVFRPEDGTWKLIHRHADPITTEQARDSVLRT